MTERVGDYRPDSSAGTARSLSESSRNVREYSKTEIDARQKDRRAGIEEQKAKMREYHREQWRREHPPESDDA